MSRRLVAATAALLALGVGGCGVPDSGDAIVDGTPLPVAADDAEGRTIEPPTPRDARDSRGLVELYFHAASSEWSGVWEHVRPFLSDGARNVMQPWRRIQVVRVSDWGDLDVRTSREHRFRVRGEVIGEMAENGAITPVSRPFSHTFVLRYDITAGTWLIDSPPLGYVLSVEAVKRRFEPVSLYFSNQRRTPSLVPDLRYLPRAVERRKQRSLLVDWWLQGPSPGLAPVASNEIPAGTKRNGNVVVEGRHVVVNLSSEADVTDRKDLLLAQLAWTLRDRTPSDGLQVQIDGRPIQERERTVHPPEAFDRLNAALSTQSDSAAFFIDGYQRVGTIPSDEGGEDDLPAVLRKTPGSSDSPNRSVTSAAVSRSGDIAALVRWNGNRLTLGVGQIRSASSDDGRPPSFQPVSGLPRTTVMSRPVWVGSSDRGVLLVAADGRLFQVRLRDLRATSVEVPPGIGPVHAVAVAPDGYRAAFVAGGRAYTAALPAQDEGDLAISDVRLVTRWIHDAVDLDWSRENHLVVAGPGVGPGGLWEISVDGIDIVKLASPSDQVPDRVAASAGVGRRGRVLIEHGGLVYEIFRSSAAPPGIMAFPPTGGAPFFAA